MPGDSEKNQWQGAMRKRGKPLCAEEKWMVVNVFSRCAEERQQRRAVHTVDPYRRTATYTGVGRRQVVDILQHFREHGQVPPAARAGNHTIHLTTWKVIWNQPSLSLIIFRILKIKQA